MSQYMYRYDTIYHILSLSSSSSSPTDPSSSLLLSSPTRPPLTSRPSPSPSPPTRSKTSAKTPTSPPSASPATSPRPRARSRAPSLAPSRSSTPTRASNPLNFNLCASRRAAAQTATHVTRQRYKTFRLPRAMCAAGWKFRYIWCFRGCSRARRWRRVISRWSLRLMWWCCWRMGI